MKKIILIAVSLTLFLANFAQSDVQLSNKTVMGLWKTKAGDEQYTLNQNGTSLLSYKGRECPGTWIVQGNMIVVNPKKLMWRRADPCSETRKFEIVSLKGNNMTIREMSDKHTIELTRPEIN
jgi:hypothetical protein